MTWLDFALLAVMFISGFLAMLRGITRELLSIFSWLAALGIAAWVGFSYQDFARKTIYDHELVGPAVLGAGVFIVALLVVSLITMKISDVMLDSRVGAIDRTFGFLFGVVRGLALIAILYVFAQQLVPEKEHPKWVREARSIHVLQSSGDFIVSLLPPNIMEMIFKKNSGNDDAAQLRYSPLPPPATRLAFSLTTSSQTA